MVSGGRIIVVTSRVHLKGKACRPHGESKCSLPMLLSLVVVPVAMVESEEWLEENADDEGDIGANCRLSM